MKEKKVERVRETATKREKKESDSPLLLSSLVADCQQLSTDVLACVPVLSEERASDKCEILPTSQLLNVLVIGEIFYQLLLGSRIKTLSAGAILPRFDIALPRSVIRDLHASLLERDKIFVKIQVPRPIVNTMVVDRAEPQRYNVPHSELSCRILYSKSWKKLKDRSSIHLLDLEHSREKLAP